MSLWSRKLEMPTLRLRYRGVIVKYQSLQYTRFLASRLPHLSRSQASELSFKNGLLLGCRESFGKPRVSLPPLWDIQLV